MRDKIRSFGRLQTFISFRFRHKFDSMSDVLPSGAPAHMKSLGEKTDETVLNEITNQPNITLGEISRILGMTSGKVHGSINRLYDKGLIVVEEVVRNGILMKRATTAEVTETPINQIQIPNSLIDVDEWGTHVYYYALSRSALGISPTQIKEWDEISLYKSSRKSVDKGSDTINLVIPDSLVNFYELPNSETELVGLGDSVILSIKSNIIPVDRPSGQN